MNPVTISMTIIGWVFILAVIWVRNGPVEGRIFVNIIRILPSAPVPALIAASLLITGTYYGFDIHLIGNSVNDAGFLGMFFALLIPASLLFVSSGIMHDLLVTKSRHLHDCHTKAYFLTCVSYNLPRTVFLLRPIQLRALLEVLLGALPVIFGELLIVEAVFNIHGIGYEIWQAAMTGQTVMLTNSLIYLSGSYLFLFLLLKNLTKKTGVRLEGY